jgi:hypothetical protein
MVDLKRGMINKEVKMTKQELISWGKQHGYKLDKIGHLRKDVGNNEYRIKLSPISARLESRVRFDKDDYGYKHPAVWVRLQSGYYKNLSIANNKLIGMK